MVKKWLVIPLVLLAIMTTTACNPGLSLDEREYNTRDYRYRNATDPDMNRARYNNGDLTDNDWIGNRYGRDTINREVNPNMVTGRNSDLYNTYAEADRLADRAAQVPGVKNATVIINGGNAYVALEIEDNITGPQKASVEYEVRQALQYSMPRYNIRVTSDNQFINQIRNIMDNFRTRQQSS